MKKKEILDGYDEYVLKTYTRTPVIFVKGKGSVLTDIDGKKYLDFFPGWGVSNVGHCHAKVMAAVRDQLDKLIHLPNNFYIIPQVKLAKEIVRHSFPGKVFYANSGAEANEAAIKFARAYGKGERYEIITTLKSFHGRTMGALSATGQTKLQDAFHPLPGGFVTVPFNDFEAIKNSVTDKTIAVHMELIQGEGGVNVASDDYIKKVRALCDEKDILFMVDEVQTGMGRTGEMFAYKHYGIEPDVMALAKALGGGLPIGAMVVKKSIADTFQPGMHGSTFGGSPLVCKAALGVFRALDSEHMVKQARETGVYLMEQLEVLKKQYDCIKDIRGKGLMIGIELDRPGKDIFDACLKQGLIINCTQGNILRLSPALNVTRKQVHRAVYMLGQAFAKTWYAGV